VSTNNTQCLRQHKFKYLLYIFILSNVYSQFAITAGNVDIRRCWNRLLTTN